MLRFWIRSNKLLVAAAKKFLRLTDLKLHSAVIRWCFNARCAVGSSSRTASAFSAWSRLIGLNGESNSLRRKKSIGPATVVAGRRRFSLTETKNPRGSFFDLQPPPIDCPAAMARWPGACSSYPPAPGYP